MKTNAFKYTEEGESITVKLYQEAGDLVLQVTDTGIGIPKEKQEKIFERFYQVESGREGSGIGLSIVKKIIEDHKGKIWAESVEGEGTTMHINLLKDMDKRNYICIEDNRKKEKK